MSVPGNFSHLIGRFRTTVDTKFHIDYDWWAKSNLDYRMYLHAQLCEECRHRFPSHVSTDQVDWVNPDTGEVHQADALEECLKSTCQHQDGFIDDGLPLTTACFRIFLTNQNMPLSPNELSRIFNQIPAVVNSTKWTAPKILRTLTGKQVYLGLRPVV